MQRKNTLTNGTIYAGLSGIQLNIPKYRYPPPYGNSSRLTYYSSLFNSLEVNSSFYKIPQPATVAKWGASVNNDFKFTFKLWKQITHNKDLIFTREDVYAFFRSINSITNKKGCLLIQLPPGANADHLPQLHKLLICIHEITGSQDWKIAIEFRNKSWYTKAVYKVLHQHKAAIVIHDKLKAATPLIDHQSDFMYVRFHGPEGNYRGSYSEDFLNEYATYIREWTEEGKTVFVYFNNTMGDAFNNVKYLNTLLSNAT